MSLKLFLGVRLPDQPYFRVPVYDVDCKKSVNQLKVDVETQLKQSKDVLGMFTIGNAISYEFS